MVKLYKPTDGCVLDIQAFQKETSRITDWSEFKNHGTISGALWTYPQTRSGWLKWADSKVDCNEAVDDSETAIDVTPDATTLIPVNSIIKIDDEIMLVTATGTTLTVTRGYEGTTAAEHANATDIYIRQIPRGNVAKPVLFFNGSSDRVNIGDVEPLKITGAVTIAAWVKFTNVSTSTIQSIAGKSNSAVANQSGYILYEDGAGKITFSVAEADATTDNIVSTLSVVADKWFFAAGIYDGSNLHVMINDTVKSAATTIASIQDHSFPFVLGAQGAVGGDYRRFLDGDLGQVWVFKRAVPFLDLKRMYNATKFLYVGV